MSSQPSKCMVIIPTLNEADNIERLITEVFLTLKNKNAYIVDVLIADGGSTDSTLIQVEKLKKINPKHLYIVKIKKRGLGLAYIQSFKYSLRRSYDTFVMMDADFSHDPSHIPSLLKKIDDGYDYVIGSRYIKGGITRKRTVKSYLANAFAKLMLDLKGDIQDMTGGFKAIRVSALKTVNLDAIKASGFVFQVNLLHDFSKQGYKIAEVPITFKNRKSGRSKMRLSDVLEFIYLTYRLNPNSRVRRLIRFCLVGASGVMVNLAVLVLLVQVFSVNPPIAYAVALEVSIISNFCLNHLYTFRAAITSPKSQRHDSIPTLFNKLIRYNLITLGGAAISFAVFYLFYKLGLHYIPSDLIAIIAATAWNYYMSVKIVWKLVDE